MPKSAGAVKAVLNTIAGPLKSLVRKLAPQPYDYLRNTFWTLKDRRRERHLASIADRWLKHNPRVVQSGPFEGLKYVDQAIGSALLPKLLGTYELELHELMRQIPAREYRRIVDVGCAEGYYAVGLARSCPSAQVLAYDINPEGRRLCQAMGQANQVMEKLVIGEFCDSATLQGLPEEPTLVISDCEGYELTLLDPEIAPKLKHFDLLVELHDFVHAGLTKTLQNRFSASHDIRLITSQPRRGEDVPSLSFLPAIEQSMAVNEYRRVGQQWAWMQSRAPFV